MKLFYTTSSPFARKIRIAASLLGIQNEIQLIPVDLSIKDYSLINPLMKVPALETRQGLNLTNSPFILEYLNELSLGRKIISSDQQEKFVQLNDQSIADGIMDAAVLRRMESQRSYDKRDALFDEKQKIKIRNGLGYFEQNIFRMKTDWCVSEISLLSALSYLEFRFSNENWLQAFPALQKWYLESLQKPEVKSTSLS